MDVATLGSVFTQTFSADAEPRKQSEAYLKGISRQPGFAVALLQLVADGNTDAMVRQAASVQWKNHLKFHWVAREDDAGLGADAPFVIPDAEKEAVKTAGIVGIMLSAPPLVQAQVPHHRRNATTWSRGCDAKPSRPYRRYYPLGFGRSVATASQSPSFTTCDARLSVRHSRAIGVRRVAQVDGARRSKPLPAARRVQVSEAVAIISATDFPAKWPTLLPELMQHIASPDYTVVIGVLKTANEIFKRCGPLRGLHCAMDFVASGGACARPARREGEPDAARDPEPRCAPRGASGCPPDERAPGQT